MVSFSGLYGSAAARLEYQHIMEDERLFLHLYENSEKLSDERIAINAASRNLLSVKKSVTNKNLIYSLLTMLSCCEDVVTGDIIRNAIEIVVQFTEDDL